MSELQRGSPVGLRHCGDKAGLGGASMKGPSLPGPSYKGPSHIHQLWESQDEKELKEASPLLGSLH